MMYILCAAKESSEVEDKRAEIVCREGQEGEVSGLPTAQVG